jgi:hypothetical protein
MNYEFSFGSLLVGCIIVIVGTVFMRFHQTIANNLGSGVSSYDRYKFWALMTCLLGFLVMMNLHWFILGNLLHAIFHLN